MTKVERGDAIDAGVLGRLGREVASSVRRRPANEERLAGALRALAPVSPKLRAILLDASVALARRKSFDRPLFLAGVRAVAEGGEEGAAAVCELAITGEDPSGLAALSAAAFVQGRALGPLLSRSAASRHPQVAFAAELARVARGDSRGVTLTAIAPKIKEASRISLCEEVLVPLVHGPKLSPEVGPALAVLRDAERHLGRWLLLAEVAHRAGDPAPLADAREKATSGPVSARLAWTFVSWALAGDAAPPTARPTLDLIARLSDRPSASRDMTFLFRLAAARALAVKPLLEGQLRGAALADEHAVRAALYLARDHGRADLREALTALAQSKREGLRGLAAAALFDVGEKDVARDAAAVAATSARSLSCVAWGTLVGLAAAGKLAGPVVTERRLRWVRDGALA